MSSELHAALGALTPEQSSMSITVSEGCDNNGNAEFFPGFELLRAGDVSLQAASDGVLEGIQPVLLFNGPHEGQLGDAPAFSGNVPFTIVEDLCRILAHPDLDRALHDEALSDAAYPAMAAAAPFLRDEVLRELPRDVLREAYDDLPVTASPEEFVEGHGNWGLREDEMALAVRLARLLTVSTSNKTAPVAVRRLMTQFELATGTASDVVDQRVQQLGVQRAMKRINEEWGIALSLGDWLLASDKEQGYWSNDFGWTSSALAASGYDNASDRTPHGLSTFPADARWVRFDEAKDFD